MSSSNADNDKQSNETEQETGLVSTPLKTIEQQVGSHVITALSQDAAVAVLTTVVVDSSGQQHVVSAPLDEKRLKDVQQLLRTSQPKKARRIPCIGFHCRLSEDDVNENEVEEENHEK